VNSKEKESYKSSFQIWL